MFKKCLSHLLNCSLQLGESGFERAHESTVGVVDSLQKEGFSLVEGIPLAAERLDNVAKKHMQS
jgi:hypothetical protein